ncbi:hypothetical protein ACFYWN_12205 [Streptomyces sp. NPDC002917]|uniref:hypothetical protein n=1 Tax=Streptomyces sp. NPDC002917 TaxID=3364671 RepID=UPI0036AC59A2
MTDPTDSTAQTAAVAVALAELRGTMAEGFATVNGSLALVAQRGEQADRRLEDHERRLDAVERGETERQKRDTGRLDGLERSRWPLPSVAALVGVSSLAVSLWR